MGERMSVETHHMWSLCLPLDRLPPETLMLLPPDVIEKLKRKEKCFIVTQYHQFANNTAQSAHQAFCNFLSLLETHKRSFPWITKIGRQTDNCYTYECCKIALHLTECKAITGTTSHFMQACCTHECHTPQPSQPY